MKFIKTIIFILVIAGAAVVSCEKLAEEETPVCKDCYKMLFQNSTGQPLDTYQFHRLCGGDVITWDNFTDSVGDSVTVRYFCN